MKVGLVVGRFQPFHKGHLRLIEKSLAVTDKIIIAVGSSNITDKDNPLSYKTRVKMLEKIIAEEGLKDKVLKIIPSPDDPSDDVWLEKLLKNAGKFDIAYGNNDWTNGILHKAGYEVMKIPYFNRKFYQGVFIRDLFRNDKNWEKNVPSYLVDFVRKEFAKSITL